MTSSVNKAVEKLSHSYAAGGNGKYCHPGNQRTLQSGIVFPAEPGDEFICQQVTTARTSGGGEL